MSVKGILPASVSAFIRLSSAAMRVVRRQSNRVVFISRQSDKPSESFLLLAERLHELEPDIKIVYSCKLGLKSEMGLSYIPLLLSQLWQLAGARACVTESYCPPVSIPKHPDSLNIVQIWHSPVALKKFGWQTIGMPEGSDRATAERMRMHAGYDAVICGSEYQRSFFAEAMNTPIEKILPLGAAFADRLMQADRQAARRTVLERHPELADKRIIAYLPTMRRGGAVPWEGLAEALRDSDITLIIRLHPLDSRTARTPHDGVIFEDDIDSRTLLLGCDGVVSDYSGAAAETAVVGNNLYFYTPDIDEYTKECGINTNPLELFGEVASRDAEQLARMIKGDYPEELRGRCRELLAGGCDGHSTDNIARVILGTAARSIDR